MQEKINIIKTLVERLAILKIRLTQSQREQIISYLELLERENLRLGLTGFKDIKDIINRLLIESLVLSEYIPRLEGIKIIDIGTGAGFPGIPLQVYYPESYITLLEANGRKVSFLKQIKEILLLLPLEIISGRAEEYGHKIGYRENFDICLAKGLAKLNEGCEYTLPFLKIGGIFIQTKGYSVMDELKDASMAITILGGKIKDVFPLKLPDELDLKDRHLVIIEKISPTPEKYPRRSGIPHKRPI